MLQPESEREAVPAALAESKACGTQGRASEFLIDMSWRELQCAAVFSKLGTAIGESGDSNDRERSLPRSQRTLTRRGQRFRQGLARSYIGFRQK